MLIHGARSCVNHSDRTRVHLGALMAFSPVRTKTMSLWLCQDRPYRTSDHDMAHSYEPWSRNTGLVG